MLDIHRINGQKFVSSFKLYRILGYAKWQYPRWARYQIVDHAIKYEVGIEHFDYIEGKEKRAVLLRPTYFITIEFAKALCFDAKTPAAKRIRQWLHTIKPLSQP